MEFDSLRRFQTYAATNIGVTSSDCAPPSGFLDLLAVCSAYASSALFHAESVHGFGTFRGFPFPVAATACRCALPLRPFENGNVPKNISEPRGFMHLESPFSVKRFYPGFTGRSSHSLYAPMRNSPFKSQLRSFAKLPFMGFTITLKQVHHYSCSAKFQRTQRFAFLFRECGPL